jgi:hypothetical protein
VSARFPKDWERFVLAARKKLTGEDFEWCLREATRLMPLSELTGADLALMEALDDSQSARIDAEEARRKARLKESQQ